MLDKNFLVTLIICACTLTLSAQTPRTVPGQYVSPSINYIKSWTAKYAEESSNALMSKGSQDVIMSVQYIDGLGRPFQSVIKEGSLTTITDVKKDIVSPIEYDAYGNESFRYKPYVSAGTADGSFRNNPFSEHATFMTAQYGGQGETFFYGETRYESSPLNRVSETVEPGNNFSGTMHLSEASRRSVKIKYWLNTATDNVQKFTVVNGAAGTFGAYNMGGAGDPYTAGTLTKIVTVNEDQKQVIEFKDKNDRIILKKVQLTAAADAGLGKNHAGWLCTYYIYDDIGNLRCVLQPAGTALFLNIGGNWVPMLWQMNNVSVMNTIVKTG